MLGLECRYQNGVSTQSQLMVALPMSWVLMGCGWVQVLMIAVGVDGLWLGSGFDGCRGC